MKKSPKNPMRTRYEQRAKRRKTNIILNTLIAIVIILILVVGGSIFMGSDPDESEGESLKTEETNKKEKIVENDKKDGKRTDKEKREKEEKSNDKAEREDEETESDQIEEVESDDPNVEKAITNPGWEPIGTEQGNGHVSSFDKNSLDWNEKVKAISYAVNISEEDLIIWFIGSGSDPENSAIGTVSTKDQADVYRVYIEWTDGGGWKPVKVEELKENDKK